LHLGRRGALEPEGEQLVCGVDVDGIDAEDVVRVVLQGEGCHEAPLVEVEAVYFVSGSGEERVAGGEVVRKRAAEARDACAVVEPALGVQLNCAVILEVY
jgi:hypothetical protein